MQEIQRLAEEFERSRKLLQALGDETRQQLILAMMQMGQCRGVRVGAIAEQTHLSRPAVSHHLRIMKEAGLIKVRREGTKNYYYFDADVAAMDSLLSMLTDARTLMRNLPDRSGDNDL